MAIQDYFSENVGSQPIDVSASTRKFQTSIIISQDANRGGVLSFLENVEQSSPQRPTRRAPLTIRPGGQNSQGGY